MYKTQYTVNLILEMKVMTCNLAEIILQPSTESFSEKRNLLLAVLTDTISNSFHCKIYFFKKLFLPKNSYKYKSLISLLGY